MLSILKGIFKRERFALHCATAGLLNFLITEKKSILYTIATTTVFTAGCMLHVSRTEWLLLTGAIASVWVAEMFNTCVEEILNLVHPTHHPKVKRVKDLAAGAVLLTALCSAITAIIIFLPKLV